MATETNIVNFHKGEYVEIILLAKDRDDSVITTPASQLITMTFGTTPDGSPFLSYDTTDSQVSLTDEPTGEYTFQFTPTDLTLLAENRTYYYNIWSELSASQPLLQAKGKFKLLNSVEV